MENNKNQNVRIQKLECENTKIRMLKKYKIQNVKNKKIRMWKLKKNQDVKDTKIEC